MRISRTYAETTSSPQSPSFAPVDRDPLNLEGKDRGKDFAANCGGTSSA